MRVLFLLFAIAVAGCEKTPSSDAAMAVAGGKKTASSGAASSSQSSAVAASTASAAGAKTDEELFNQWQDAMVMQVESDARAGATRTFASREDAKAFLTSLSPSGFRPRPEFFGAFHLDAEDVDPFAKRMAAYARAHPEVLERRIKVFGDELEALLKAMRENIERQFPSQWATDPIAALADAKQRGRATFMVFFASWSAASLNLDHTLSDPALQKALDDRFVAVRVDMTEDDSPAVKKAGETFKVTGLPVYLVFDKTGREVARKTELVDAAGLLALLARAK